MIPGGLFHCAKAMTRQIIRVVTLVALMYGGAIIGMNVAAPRISSGSPDSLRTLDRNGVAIGAAVGLILFIAGDLLVRRVKRR
jgi:hypothetical protein